jgi:hypothetical protein
MAVPEGESPMSLDRSARVAVGQAKGDSLMADPKHNPDPTADQKPQNQTGEDKGTIKGPQIEEHNAPERWDTSRGSGPAQGGTSGRRG